MAAPAPPATRSISLPTMALQGILPIAIAVAAATGAIFALEVDDLGGFARAAAPPLPAAFAVGVAASYLGQIGRRYWAWLFTGLSILLAVGGVANTALRRGDPGGYRRDLGPAERQELALVRVDGKPFFRHPTLGFAFPQLNPGFAFSPELTASLRSQVTSTASQHAWAFSQEFSSTLLLAVIDKRAEVSRGDLLESVTTLRGGLLNNLKVGGSAVEELENAIVWDAVGRESRLHLTIAGTRHVRINSWVVATGGAEYIVTLIGLSIGQDAFAELMASFRRPTDTAPDPMLPL